MPVLMGEVVEWVDKRCLVEGVQDHDEVERRVDAREELPDEANWYSTATMTSVKLASEAEVSRGSKMSEAARTGVDAATWVRQKREKRQIAEKIITKLGFSTLLRSSCVTPITGTCAVNPYRA